MFGNFSQWNFESFYSILILFENLYKEIRPKLPDGPQAVIARGAEVSIVEIRDREQLLAALKTAKGQ